MASKVEPKGLMFPVFCTADLPTETIDLLLERYAEHYKEDSYRLFIVTDVSDAAIAAIDNKHSQSPTKAFKSPFVGNTIPQLNEIYEKKFERHPDFSNVIFFVLDADTPKTETLLLVESYPTEKIDDNGDEIDTLRTDFWVARQIAMPADFGNQSLLEDRDGGRVYTIDDDIPIEL